MTSKERRSEAFREKIDQMRDTAGRQEALWISIGAQQARTDVTMEQVLQGQRRLETRMVAACTAADESTHTTLMTSHAQRIAAMERKHAAEMQCTEATMDARIQQALKIQSREFNEQAGVVQEYETANERFEADNRRLRAEADKLQEQIRKREGDDQAAEEENRALRRRLQARRAVMHLGSKGLQGKCYETS